MRITGLTPGERVAQPIRSATASVTPAPVAAEVSDRAAALQGLRQDLAEQPGTRAEAIARVQAARTAPRSAQTARGIVRALLEDSQGPTPTW